MLGASVIANSLDGLGETLAQLVSMGFDATVAQSALQKVGGDLDAALEILTADAEAQGGMPRFNVTSEGSQVQPQVANMNPPGVGVDAIEQLVGMGFDAAKATAALAKSGGDLDAALELLTAEGGGPPSPGAADSRSSGAADSRSGRGASKEFSSSSSSSSQVHPVASNGDLDGLDVDDIEQLISMGFDVAAAHSALEQAGGSLESAVEILAASERAPGGSSQKGSRQPSIAGQVSPALDDPIEAADDGTDDAVEQLVGMGFGIDSVNSALQKSGGAMEGALETLLSQAGS